MNETDFEGVQKHGGHVVLFFEEFVLLVATMRPVADDGVEDVRKMTAYLVHPACFRFNLYKRKP